MPVHPIFQPLLDAIGGRMEKPVSVRDALRECIDGLDAALGMVERDNFIPSWDELRRIRKNARAALAADEKGESELVAALEYIAAPQDGVSRGTAWDQLADVREAARKAIAKHAKE